MSDGHLIVGTRIRLSGFRLILILLFLFTVFMVSIHCTARATVNCTLGGSAYAVSEQANSGTNCRAFFRLLSRLVAFIAGSYGACAAAEYRTFGCSLATAGNQTDPGTDRGCVLCFLTGRLRWKTDEQSRDQHGNRDIAYFDHLSLLKG